MTRVAARHADEVVLNLVPPEHVTRGPRDGRRRGDGGRQDAARPGGVGAGCPRSRAARRGHSSPPSWRSTSARPGTARCSPSSGSPSSCAARGTVRAGPSWPVRCRSSSWSGSARVGSADEVIARISAYHDAGADVVGVAPSTAEDPGGRAVLTALSKAFQRPDGGCVMTLVNAQCRLAARPVGLPKPSDWDYVEEPAPGAGRRRVPRARSSTSRSTRRCAVDERRPLLHPAGRRSARSCAPRRSAGWSSRATPTTRSASTVHGVVRRAALRGLGRRAA